MRGMVALLGGADGGADADGVRPVRAQYRLRLFCRNALASGQITKLFGQYVRRATRTAAEMHQNPVLHDGGAVARE